MLGLIGFWAQGSYLERSASSLKYHRWRLLGKLFGGESVFARFVIGRVRVDTTPDIIKFSVKLWPKFCNHLFMVSVYCAE